MNFSEILGKYSFLGFSEEQREMVLKYEKLNESHSYETSLSIWEKWDLEDMYFSDILDEFQWEMYKKRVIEDKAAYKEELRSYDKTQIESLVLEEESLFELKRNVKQWFLESTDLLLLEGFVQNSHRLALLKYEYK